MAETDFKKEYTLKQQTPMIHFQSDEKGATLRASEVKPKLDKFLLTQLGKGDYSKGIAQAKEKKWLIGKGDHPALNYKMRFIAKGDSRVCPKIHKNFFGNLGQNGKYKTVMYDDTIELHIVCFSPLIQEIDKLIIPFFLLHNFGTRQNKGFGSFKVVAENGVEKQYNTEEEMKKFFGEPFYVLKVSKSSPLNDIYDLYRLMKSGVNPSSVKEYDRQNQYYRAFIYQYFHRKDIGNEKAYIKMKGVAPVVGRTVNNKKHENNQTNAAGNDGGKFKYVRSMLGICEKLEYINKVDEVSRKFGKEDKITIAISHTERDESKKIMRYASPILFKVVDGVVYILPQKINPKMLNQEFKFSKIRKKNNTREKDGNKTNSVVINTPDVFDLNEFLSDFEVYMNKLMQTSEFQNQKIVRLRGKLEKHEVKGGEVIG